MSRIKRVLSSRATLTLGAWVAYVLVFIPLYRLVGQIVAALAMLPVVVTGWLFGMRAGLLTGLLTFPLNMLLTALVTGTAWEMMAPGGLFGSVLILLIGAVVGRLHDLGEQVKWELAERKRAEEALKELMGKTEQAKEEWESTADSLPELICLVDDRGRIIRANRTVETWNLGWVVDVKGREAHELLHPDCMDVSCYFDSFWKQAWEGAMRGQPAQCEAYDEVLKRHVLVRVQPWKGEAVGSTVVVVQDITDRKRAEEALKEYSERLEEMVEERTAALKAINEQLRLGITERQQAEEALRESEEKYRTILESIEDSYYEVDLAGNLTFFNDSLCRLHGYSEDELMGMNNRQYMDDETAKIVYQTFNAVYRTGKPAKVFDWEVIRKDGTRRFVEASVSLIRDSTGETAGFRGIIRDITERKRTEEALRDEKALVDALMDNITDSIYFKDRQCRLIRISRKMMRDLNLDEMSQAIGKTDVDLFGEEFGRKTLVEDQRIMATGEPIMGLIESRQLEDGQINWTLTTKVPLRNTSGQIVGLAGITREINELMRAEEALRVSEERFALAVQGSNDGIWDWDIQNNSLYWSPRLKELLGYADDELDVDFETLVLLLHPDDRGHTEAVIEAHLKGRGLYDVEQRLRTKSGQYRWFRARGQALWDEAGQPLRMVGFTADITERKRAEEQLERYAVELEQANEEVKQFAYIVSHDLRAPLVNLKGFTTELRFALEAVDSAMETALPHLDEKRRQDVVVALKEDVPEALGFINSSVTHMDHFISALLKLSRLGRCELHPEPVDVEALVQVSLESLAHQIEERQVEVRVGPLPKVVADRTSMEQIMGNLLGNAVKYLEPDRPGEIEITAERGPNETTFHIHDNGRGIAAEDMDKVFAPFRRVGRQDVPGEGMGLPYVQALVRRHGGRIWCESELGVGTTFSFTISNHIAEGDNHV